MTLQSKVIGEAITVSFEFLDQILVGETLSAPVITVSVFSGTDPSPNNIRFGGAVVSGASVTQHFYQGLGGVTYILVCTVTGSSGRSYVAKHFLAVLTNFGDPTPGEGLELTGTISATACIDEEVYFVLTITGGYAPYGPVTISVGALPSGLDISIVDSTVVISGIPDDSAGDYDFTVRLEDFAGNIATLALSTELIVCVGGNLYVAQSNTVGVQFTIVDTANNVILDTVGVNDPARIPVFSNDAEMLYFAKDIGIFKMDPDTEVVSNIHATAIAPSALLIDSTNTYLYSVSLIANKFYKIRVSDDAVILEATLGIQCVDMCWSADQSKIYICGYSNSGFIVFTTATEAFTTLGAWSTGGLQRGVALDPVTGDIVTVGRTTGAAVPHVWRWSTDPALDPGHANLLNGAVMAEAGSDIVVINNKIYCSALSAASNLVYVYSSALTLLGTITVGLEPLYMTVNNARTRLYVTNTTQGTTTIINPATDTVVATVDTVDDPYGSAVREAI